MSRDVQSSALVALPSLQEQTGKMSSVFQAEVLSIFGQTRSFSKITQTMDTKPQALVKTYYAKGRRGREAGLTSVVQSAGTQE